MKYNKDKIIYMIHKDLPWEENNKTKTFYGWTQNKKLLKAFLSIRNKDYYIEKLFDYEIDDAIEYHNNKELFIKKEFMLDIIELESRSGDLVTFISNEDEMVKAENSILNQLYHACDVDKFNEDNIAEIIELYQHLKDKYIAALEFIGYIPNEFRELDYDCRTEYPCEYTDDEMLRNMFAMAEPLRNGTVYSLEAFIKVLRGEFRV